MHSQERCPNSNKEKQNKYNRWRQHLPLPQYQQQHVQQLPKGTSSWSMNQKNTPIKKSQHHQQVPKDNNPLSERSLPPEQKKNPDLEGLEEETNQNWRADDQLKSLSDQTNHICCSTRMPSSENKSEKQAIQEMGSSRCRNHGGGPREAAGVQMSSPKIRNKGMPSSLQKSAEQTEL